MRPKKPRKSSTSKSKARWRVTRWPQRMTLPILHPPHPLQTNQPNPTQTQGSESWANSQSRVGVPGHSCWKPGHKLCLPAPEAPAAHPYWFPSGGGARTGVWGSASYQPADNTPARWGCGTQTGQRSWKGALGPAGASRKGRRKAPAQAFNSKDTMCRKRSVEAILPPTRNKRQERLSSYFCEERGRREQAMNEEGTAFLWCGSQSCPRHHAILHLTPTTGTRWPPGRESNMICTPLNKFLTSFSSYLSQVTVIPLITAKHISGMNITQGNCVNFFWRRSSCQCS